MRTRLLLFLLCSLSVSVFIFLLAFFPIQDSDVFMYMALGRWYFTHGAWPTTDPFVFTTKAPIHIMLEWGSFLFYTALYNLAGLVGLITFKAIWIVLIFAVPIALAFYLGCISIVPFILVTIGALAASHRFTERANLFSELFSVITLTIVLLEHHRPGKLKYFLPLLFLLWPNLHPGYLLGLLFIFLLIGFQLVSKFQKFSAPNKDLKNLIIIAFVCVLVTLVAPAGLDSYISPFKMLFDSTWKFYSFYYVEYLPLLLQYRGSVELKAYLALSALTFLIFVNFYRKRSLKTPYLEFAIFVILLYSTFSKGRMISTSSYCFCVLGTYLYAQSKTLSDTPRKSSIVFFMLLILGLGYSSYYIYENGYRFAAAHRYPQNVFKYPVDTRHQPVRAVDFLQRRGTLQGNIFNEHSFGAYLAWVWNGTPAIFYHGLVDDPKLYLEDYIGVGKSDLALNQIADKYNIRYFILENLLFMSDNTLPSTYHFLLHDPRWKLTFQDESAVIFEKVIPTKK